MTYINEIKIVLVDDHKLLRDGLRNIIEQRSNMHIIEKLLMVEKQ